MSKQFDVHGLSVTADLPVPIPDQFRSNRSDADVEIREYETPVETPDRTTRAGVFEYWTDREKDRLTIEYKIPVLRPQLTIETVPERPVIRYTSNFKRFGNPESLVEPLLAMAMLEQNRAFVHAGAVAVSGEGVLITAPPDSGKTSTVLGLCDGHAEFMADDQVILSPDGMVFSYPRSVNLSPFTTTGPLERSDSLNWRVRRWLCRSRFELLASEFFGINMGEHVGIPDRLITDQAPLNSVVVLGTGERGVTELNEADAVQHLITSSFELINPFAHYILAYYNHIFGADPAAIIDHHRGLLQRALEGVSAYRVSAQSLDDYPKLIEQTLNQ